jgi:hypothetical protein
MTPPNTTGNILDEIFAPLIDSPSLTLTTTYWKEAKRQIQALIEQEIKKARIDEETSTLQWVLNQLSFDGSDQDVKYIENRTKELGESNGR